MKDTGVERGTVVAMAEESVTGSRNSRRGGLAEKRRFLMQCFLNFSGSPISAAVVPNSEPGAHLRPAPACGAGRQRHLPAARRHCSRAGTAGTAEPPSLRTPGPAPAGRAAAQGHRLPCLRDICYVLQGLLKPLSCRASHRR